jgi:nucleotide-binding universal stress UspA family protein
MPRQEALMDTPPTEAVVVALDPSGNSRMALEWAADEADLRGAVLRIGHAWRTQTHRLPPVPRHDSDAARNAAWDFLEGAAEDMRRCHDGLRVEPELRDESPTEGLLRMADADASLLVTGRRGLNPLMTYLLGSVSMGVVAHTPVPAVVVPPGRAAYDRGPVVVGVAPGEAGPLEFAFVQAERSGVPLRVVRAWMPPQAVPGHLAAARTERGPDEREESAELEKLLGPLRAAHPDVPVTVQVSRALAEQAIVEASGDASLVVIGAHRKQNRLGLPVGRVPHRVLHLAHAPVAVVPH